MADREPPDWGRDSLSKFFKDAEHNARATAANYPDVFQFLGRLQSAFQCFEEAVEKDSGWNRFVPRFLLIRAHSTILAAIRVAMSGQIAEAFPLLRAAIEMSWYALHMASDAPAGQRAEIWLKRNDDATATARCKSEFTVKNVRTTHEGLDALSAAELHRLYETLIDHGAHPNQMGVLSALRSTEAPNEINYSVGILYPSERPVMVTLRLSAAVGIGALKIFALVYPERFALVGLDEVVRELVDELNTRFERFGRGERTA